MIVGCLKPSQAGEKVRGAFASMRKASSEFKLEVPAPSL